MFYIEAFVKKINLPSKASVCLKYICWFIFMFVQANPFSPYKSAYNIITVEAAKYEGFIYSTGSTLGNLATSRFTEAGRTVKTVNTQYS